MIIYKEDLKLVGFCHPRTREFFKAKGMNWQNFIENGCDAQDFLNTQDAMAIELVEAVKKARME